MRTILKLAALAAIMVPVHVIVVLAVLGVPRPPAITAEDVGRVGWGPVLDDASQLWSARTSKSLAAWMPDGSGVLVRGRRWMLDSRLYHVEEPGGPARLLSQIPRNATVYAQPDRRHMVLGWDRDGDEQYRLYRWDLDGSRPVPLTPEPERASFGAFEPGGPRIAYASTRRNGRDFDVYVMDPTDPASDRLVLEVEGMWAVVGWSPTGRDLLLAHLRSNVDAALHLLDLERGTLRRLTAPSEAPVRYGAPQWSPDGRTLFYASNRESEFMHLRRLDMDSGEETVLFGDLPWDVASVRLSHDGRTLLVGVNEDGSTRYYTADAGGASLVPLELFSSGQLTAVLHPTEATVGVDHVDASGITRAYVYDLESGRLTQWAGPEPRDDREARAMEELGARLVRYPTFDEVDGEPRRISAFVYPGTGTGPRPVVIDIHGGPEAQARLRASPSPLQRQGITLITPNVRGSTGYGKTFASLDDQYLREDAVRDIGSLLDWIAEQPDLDAGRVAVTGGSYGGYMVLASLVHYGPRLRCGIDIVGVSNFVTFLENTADYRRDLRRAEYGDERIPEMRAFLESIAPLNNAERITSPLLVVQGARDPRVPVSESRQLVDRVRSNGLEVSYLEASNEGHGFRQPWNAFYAGIAQRELLRACLME